MPRPRKSISSILPRKPEQTDLLTFRVSKSLKAEYLELTTIADGEGFDLRAGMEMAVRQFIDLAKAELSARLNGHKERTV